MLYVYSLITFHLNFDFTASVWYRLCRALFVSTKSHNSFIVSRLVVLLLHVSVYVPLCVWVILSVCKSCCSFLRFLRSNSVVISYVDLSSRSPSLLFQLLFKLAKLNVFVVRLLDRRTFFTSGLSVRVSSCCSGCSSSFIRSQAHTNTYTHTRVIPTHLN